MKSQAKKENTNSNNIASANRSNTHFVSQFADNRSEASTQRKMQELANNSADSKQSMQLQTKADTHSKTIQKYGADDEELMQGKFNSIQREKSGEKEEEELMQAKANPLQKKENKTGLPDNIKSGVENLSGLSLDDVKVHYNSDKPAKVQANAYAQGSDIHLASGQEKHLPHEAWHVVQQKQGRVKPTLQLKGSMNVNDDKNLEKEADVMGAKAMSEPLSQHKAKNTGTNSKVVQRNLFSFLGLGKPKEPEFVPQSDTSAFTEKKADKIEKGMTEAFKMATKAKAKVDKNNSRYKTFMDSGAIDKGDADTRVAHVKSGFDKIIKTLKEDKITFAKYELNDGEEDETYAYVYSARQEKKIYLGGSFWGAKIKGYDSKAGTIIHELSHELHATKDHVYGQSGAKKLAKKNPFKATTNADNYEYFAEKA